MCHVDDDIRNNNIDNLYWGDHQDNVADAKRNDRYRKGSEHSSAILTEEDVIWIREKYIPQSKYYNLSVFSKKFGVGYSSVFQAAKGNTWKHVYPRKAIHLRN